MKRLERKHKLAVGVLLGIVIAVLIAVLLSAAGFHYPYRTLPKPPLPPGQKAPTPSCPHVMGGCLPKPTASNAALITATNQGPDLSNNDPVYGPGAWAKIAAHNAFAVFKVNQGTYYNDRTAAPMAADARRAGLVVGGYDFLDVCHAPAASEAFLFVSDLRADNLLGPGTLAPTGDAEWPLGTLSCNGRDWIAAWGAEVAHLTGRQPMFYTGAWWWQPHIGSYWPNPSLAWISGYGVRYPYMPSGRSQLDIWQFTDAGWNGVSTSDLSIWRDGAAAFQALTRSGPSSAQVRNWIAERGSSLHAYYRGPRQGYRCRQPVLTSGYCGQHAWRVDHFQKLIDTNHGFYPRCFGPHAVRGAAECQIVRPAVAVWSRAAAASLRAECPAHTVTCNGFRQRVRYFQGRINHTLATSRL